MRSKFYAKSTRKHVHMHACHLCTNLHDKQLSVTWINARHRSVRQNIDQHKTDHMWGSSAVKIWSIQFDTRLTNKLHSVIISRIYI